MAVAFERRLASFRAAHAAVPRSQARPPARGSSAIAERLAAELDGELVRTEIGAFVRLEGRGDVVPVDRERLARLPGQPPPLAPLVCLDTETTGLATASGTLAFLVGLGWWQGTSFRQVQLLLPDHAFEPALLEELARHIPARGWLVTYNGRTFDWPLLVARYRMARREAPPHAGHLDLLPFVRRVFRHRLPDARLRTVEGELLGRRRDRDIDGWEIPGRYFEFLRSGVSRPLVDVIRHNEEDVRSLALLVGFVERRLSDPDARTSAPPGDLAGLARAFARERRVVEALACLDAAVAAVQPSPPPRDPFGRTAVPVVPDEDDLTWLSRHHRPDFGGRPLTARTQPWPAAASSAMTRAWSVERIVAERARLLRRVGRYADAESAWLHVAEAGGAPATQGWIEVAKVREHHLGDPVGALEATLTAARLVHRQVLANRMLSRLDRDLAMRAARLRRRLARTSASRPSAAPASGRGARLTNAALCPPDRGLDPSGTGLRPLRALDPPQEGAPDRRAEGLELGGGRWNRSEGGREVARYGHGVDVVEGVP
jgi:hypothetical protein